MSSRPLGLSRRGRRAARRLVVSALVLAAAWAIGAAPAGADHGPAGPGGRGADVRAAVQQWRDALGALALEYQEGDAAARSRLHAELLGLAARRRDALLALMETDAAAVRSAALPRSLRAALPPAVQAQLEEDLEVEGTLEVLHADGGPRSGHYWALATPLGVFSLHWAGPEPKGRLTGDRVRVRGLRVGLALALGAGELVPVAAAPLPSTLGGQSTLVILVNFADDPVEPYTAAYADSVIFGTTSDFYRENSFDQTWLTGAVRGWYTISESSTACDYNKISSLANQAATADGVNLAAYPRRVYAFPSNACGWWGLGTVGGNPSRAWINGSLELAVAGHEIGHNLGLYHSHALECGSVTLGGSCSSIEYGDTLDIMGTGANHFNAPQKERLGWLGWGASPPITDASLSGTYTLSPYETEAAGAKALRIPRAAGGALYVELRRPVGFDADLAGNSNVENGVVVHWAAGPDDIYLLDMTPASSAWWDPALAVGQTFIDAALTITPLWVNGTGAGVAVTVGEIPCTAAAPTVTIAPAGTVWAAPGDSPSYSVSVRNNDGAGCGETAFALSLSAPAGVAGELAPASVTVAPGATASTTLTVDVPAALADGLYQLGVSAAREGAGPSGSVTASLMVSAGPKVSVSTDRPSYRAFQSMTATAVVVAGGVPLAGTAVGFTVTKADGKKVKAVATTNTSGVATYRYFIRSTDIKGKWRVRAAASVNGLVGAAARAFTVQ